MDTMGNKLAIWDLPVRVFHWLLVIAVFGAFASALTGGNWMVWHGRFGLAIIGLITFRICWGVVGSHTARFTHFLRGPRAIMAYLRGDWHGIGHNPLGALSVLAMLLLFAVQALGGLFANDDIAFNGPLRSLVDKSTSDLITSWHHDMFWVLIGLIVLHVGAVSFYTIVKRDNLISPMITGYKTAQQSNQSGNQGGHWLALLGSIAVAAVVVWVAAGGLLPPPPQPPVTPDW